MSNCVVAGAEFPIVRAASRLALRAPALRAATALTRPARRAAGLSCGRHGVPAGTTVAPQHVIANHGVECGDDFSHDGDDDNLRPLSSSLQTIVEDFERGIAAAGDQGRHVEHTAHGCTSAPDAAYAFEFATVEVIGRQADESGDLLPAHLPARIRRWPQ